MLRKHELKLLVLGIVPLLAGIVVEKTGSGFARLLMDLPFLLLWGWLSYRVADADRKPLPQAFALCAVSLLILMGLVAYIAYQEQLVGVRVDYQQVTMLPFFFAPSLIMSLIPGIKLLPGTIALPLVCAAVGGSLFLASFTGCRIKSFM